MLFLFLLILKIKNMESLNLFREFGSFVYNTLGAWGCLIFLLLLSIHLLGWYKLKRSSSEFAILYWPVIMVISYSLTFLGVDKGIVIIITILGLLFSMMIASTLSVLGISPKNT